LIGYLILAVVMCIGFWRIEQLGQRIIEENARQDAGLRAMLCQARDNTLTSKQRTPAEKQAIVQFYDDALSAARLQRCSPYSQP
jgi:hypothetical protein